MTARTLMIQGTASSAGKSILVTALCRIFRQDGYRVAPFKAQNMALNSHVTPEGGEIGRAQAVQAEASGIDSSVDMNPVLLKPEADSRCQVIVMGKVLATISPADYYQQTPRLLEYIHAALQRLRDAYDIVVIEGAGSPAEINLKSREIVNMRVARLAEAPVLLVGDIDKGGVFASLVGTLELLEEYERDMVKGLIINKFRGDISLLHPALEFVEKRTGKPVLGVIPYFRDIRIAQEDSVYLDERQNKPPLASLDIAVIRLPHISNYDDFDPLETADSTVRYVRRPDELGSPHLIILPGTKSTVNDLRQIWKSGLADGIIRQAAAGTPVLGVCGGYQMLGKKILDPEKVESPESETEGLGLLDTVTEFAAEKSTTRVKARVLANIGIAGAALGQEITGYEIHMGRTRRDSGKAAIRVIATPKGGADYEDGTVSASGTVMGTYLHGLFHNDGFRQATLAYLRRRAGILESQADTKYDKERQYDRLADLVRENLDMAAIYRSMGTV